MATATSALAGGTRPGYYVDGTWRLGGYAAAGHHEYVRDAVGRSHVSYVNLSAGNWSGRHRIPGTGTSGDRLPILAVNLKTALLHVMYSALHADGGGLHYTRHRLDGGWTAPKRITRADTDTATDLIAAGRIGYRYACSCSMHAIR